MPIALKPGIDQTTELQQWLDNNAGKRITWSTGQWLTSRLFPKSGTQITFEPGVEINLVSGGIGVFRFANVENIKLDGSGCILHGANSSSSVVYFAGSKNCTFDGFVIEGSNKDCVYIGIGADSTMSEGIKIQNTVCRNASRNGVSVAAATNTVIDGCELTGTTGSPGAGIDVEANDIGFNNSNTIIENSFIHSNAKSGVQISFGQSVTIRNNRIENNNIGVALTSQGNVSQAQKTVDFAADGTITCPGIDMQTGMLVVFPNSTKPVELESQVRWTAYRIDNDSFKVAPYFGADTINSLTLTGQTATVMPYRASLSGHHSVIDNEIRDNAKQQIFCSLVSYVYIARNRIFASVNNTGLQVSYTNSGHVENNHIEATTTGTTAQRGMNVGQATRVSTAHNTIINFTGVGLALSGFSFSRSHCDRVINCGYGNTKAVQVSKTESSVIDGIEVYNDPDKQPANTIVIEPSCNNVTLINDS